MLRKILYAAAHCRSFLKASEHLDHLAELTIPVKQVERIAHRLGDERLAQRDAEVAAWQQLPLARKFEAPPAVPPPDLAVVMVDGGRMQFRDPPEEPSHAGPEAAAAEADWTEETPSQASHWHEDKIGLVLTMQATVAAADPCPQIPPGFLDVLRIPKLVRELGKSVSPNEDTLGAAVDLAAEEEALQEKHDYQPPELLRRQVVATAQSWRAFAPIVATAAYLWALQGAARQAFVGDGSANNWVLHKRFFGSFVAILDFIHALSYVFAGALAGRPFAEGWACYRKWIQWVWEGDVGQVIEALQQRQQEVGLPQQDDGETSVRKVVDTTLRYLRNHQDKMHYAEYRQQGLPLTSSLMESGVKQVNERVKGTEKFWSDEGGEAILQLRADALGDDEEIEAFWKRREAAATGQRRYRSRAG